MATCLHCPTELTGRTKVCPACKKRVEKTLVSARRKTKKAAAKKAPAAKKTTAPKSKATPVPDGLRPRGAALWKSLAQSTGTPAGELALEACRMADRLERLDSVLTGRDEWFVMVEFPPASGQYVVRVDGVLDQARVQAIAFKQLLAELGVTAVPKAPPVPVAVNKVDEIRQRREQKAAK